MFLFVRVLGSVRRIPQSSGCAKLRPFYTDDPGPSMCLRQSLRPDPRM